MHGLKNSNKTNGSNSTKEAPLLFLVEVPACANDQDECEQWDWLRWFWGNRNRKNVAEALDTTLHM